jgi:hypothetical protein
VSATPRSPGPDEIRSYLLRRLGDTARTRFEEAYFSDDGLFDRIESEEDRLVSDYVLDHLTKSDRHRFEESLLRTPYYQDRVDTTSRLHRRLVRVPGVLPSRREAPADKPSPARPRRLADQPLFPPGTGKAIAIVVLGVLLVAALLSAVQLKRDVEILKAAQRPGAGGPAPGIELEGAATLRVVALTAQGEVGPPVLHLEERPQSSLLLVIPRESLPESNGTIRISLVSQQGGTIWESPALARPRRSIDGDLTVRLAPGLPARGISSLLASGGDSAQALLSVLETSPSMARH